MDPIKEAFNRAKQDISLLTQQVESLSFEMQEIKQLLIKLSQTDKQTVSQTTQQITPADNLPQTPYSDTSIDTFSYKMPLQSLKSPFLGFSTGNRGVPTDSQTDKPTDSQTHYSDISLVNSPLSTAATSALASIENVRQELVLRFQGLTSQEIGVFATIYQLEDKGLSVDYPLIAQTLSLSESSARDYVQKLLVKGIPIHKTKLNNKKVFLSIAPELRKIASLSLLLDVQRTAHNKSYSARRTSTF